MVSKEFTERLEERIAEFTEDGGQFELQEVLALMFEGIQNNYALTMAYVVDVENHDGHLYYHEYDDGTETAFAFTAEPDIRNNSTVGLSLRAILDEIMENEDWQHLKRLAGDKVIRLKNQMRIAASDETIRWIRDFVDQRRIYPIPVDDSYDLQIFDRERMLIELVRYKSKLSFNYYKEILGNYRRILPQLNTEKIRNYAEAVPKSDKVIRTLRTEVY